MTPEDLVSTVGDAFRKVFTEEKSFGRGGERTHTWASGWRPCNRAMALDLLHPEDMTIEADGFARMALGSDYEMMIRTRLERAGAISEPRFTVEGQQQRISLKGSVDAGEAAGQVVLTGKIDGKLRFPGELIPFDCKGGESVRRARTIDDLLRNQWAARGVHQLLAYLLDTGEPLGLFVTDTGGLPGLIPVVLEEHLDRAEQFLSAAETSWRCKNAGAPLPLFSSNPEHCTRCDHRGRSCSPPWFSGEGPYVSTDPELADLVDKMLDHEDAAKEHARASKRVKDLCRGKELVLIGEHTLTGKPHGKGWRTTVQRKEGEEVDA